MVIIVIYSILKNINNDFGKSASEIAFYAQYILIITIVMSSVVSIIDLSRESIMNMVSFMQMLVPLLMTLMIATGSISTTTIIQPIILFAIQFIANIITNLILPFVLISTVLNVVSNISSKVQIDKLSKILKSSAIWIVGIALTCFVTVLSLEGTMASAVDGLSVKVAKTAVSTFVPVVGKILGDAVDSVMGASNILKNAIGIVGIVTIIGICVIPIIKLAILTIIFYITSSVVEPIADSRILKLLDCIGDTYKIMLGILFAVTFMLIIRTHNSYKNIEYWHDVWIGEEYDKCDFKLGTEYSCSSNCSYNYRNAYT